MAEELKNLINKKTEELKKGNLEIRGNIFVKESKNESPETKRLKEIYEKLPSKNLTFWKTKYTEDFQKSKSKKLREWVKTRLALITEAEKLTIKIEKQQEEKTKEPAVEIAKPAEVVNPAPEPKIK